MVLSSLGQQAAQPAGELPAAPASPHALAANKRLARRVVEEVLNGSNPAAADELIAPDYVEHSPLPEQAPGLLGLKRALRHFREAFPDFRMWVEDVIAEGDRVAVRSTATATHSGVFLGVPPTGRRVRWTAIDVIRIAGGKQVEHWGNEEVPKLLDQRHLLHHLDDGTRGAGD